MKQLKEYLESEQILEYRPLPFWSWNDKLEQGKLKEQIHWMNDNSIGGFFMHARSGLKTEYLSEEWMEDIEACADEAKKLNMKAWAYDENGWPSGFAGGKLLEDPKNCDRYILWNTGAYDASATVTYCMEGERLIRVNAGEAEKEYLNLYIHTAVSTADILNPEVVDKFIALTHEKYKERFGEGFSDKIEGFFTDEPQYQRWNTPYTDVMERYFQEEYGEDIKDSLGLLFVEKEGWRKFRYRYWKGMQSLMLKGFAEKVYGWCQENGVKLTGHYVEESSLGFQLMCCAGVMPFYEFEDIPGIDWLGKATTSDLASRQVGSAAAQLGKKRVITETFGCCGWDVTPAELRRIAGFQYVTGVNMMCHHLIPYSERGIRKYDYPAHYGLENPWVREAFGDFNRYFTRLGYLLGEGKAEVRVAMLHPIRSAYFDYKREEEAFGISELEKDLFSACRTLSGHGIEYHFLDETLLAKYGFVEGKSIGCGKCTYEYLVLPPILTMDATTEELLRKYVVQGGKVLLLGERPSFLEAEPYTYDYLESNCTIEDLMAVQPVQISEYGTELYTTYRSMEDMAFIYVVNASETKSYVQTFSCGENIRSFLKVDLVDLTTKQVPLTIELQPGEDAFLIWNEETMLEEKVLKTCELRFNKAQVKVEENYLPIDYIRYSTDGENYSKPWPCLALFQKLLRDRYEGKLFLKYEFEVHQIPEKLFLRIEENRQCHVWLNGQPLEDMERKMDGYINEYDIADVVQKGLNECVIETNWYEDAKVYHALFGENVTESLKNCIEYDSELQPIEVAGDFGVYPTKEYYESEDDRYVCSDGFFIGVLPEQVGDFATEGFPFFAGEITLTEKLIFEDSNIWLDVPGDYQMAFVSVNGQPTGRLFFEKKLDVSHVAKKGENEVEVRFFISNKNHQGPYHVRVGKGEGISPATFGAHTEWKDDKWGRYHDYYDIKKFYAAEMF